MAHHYHQQRSPQPAETGATTFLAAREQYMTNKNTQYHNKAKSLLYGGDSTRPMTPVHHGKKSVPHAGEHGAAPFATYDGATLGLAPTSTQSPPQAGHLSKTKVKKAGADKISSTQYNPEVYRQALIGNAANLSAMKTRNWGSAGLLGQHPATPKVSTPQDLGVGHDEGFSYGDHGPQDDY